MARAKLFVGKSQSLLLELLHKLVDAPQLVGYLDVLRTVLHALAAADAVVGLAQLGDSAVVAHQDGDTSYSAIIVPQRIDNRQPLVEVEMMGVSYLFESKFLFKPGTEHLVNLVISENPDKVKINIGGEKQNW